VGLFRIISPWAGEMARRSGVYSVGIFGDYGEIKTKKPI
jgi:hypothetical protein